MTIYCIKQMTPSDYTLFGPTFPTIKCNNPNKKSVRFSKNNEVFPIPPKTHTMKR